METKILIILKTQSYFQESLALIDYYLISYKKTNPSNFPDIQAGYTKQFFLKIYQI